MTSSAAPANRHHLPLEVSVKNWAADRMPSDRFNHTAGVVKTVTQLAQQHGIQHIAQLRLAGWIHDAAKSYSPEELLRLAAAADYPVRAIERLHPMLLHGLVAAFLARDDLGLDDPIVFSAAAYHTTGHPQMRDTDKALFIADAIEPSRDMSWAQQARSLARENLDQALLFIITKQMRHLLKRGVLIDPRSLALRNQLLADGVPFTP